MDNKKKQAGSSSSSSSSSSLDHLFGPKGSSSAAASSPSSSSGLLDSIFPPPSTVMGRKQDFGSRGRYPAPDETDGNNKGQRSRKDRSSMYQNETVEPCNFSSSIYYGGQENYSPRSKTNDDPHAFKKDGGDDDPDGSNSNGASRGNWWQGSVYY